MALEAGDEAESCIFTSQLLTDPHPDLKIQEAVPMWQLPSEFHLIWAIRVYPGLPRRLSGKESTCNAGDSGLIPGSGKFPWRRKRQPSPVFLPGKSTDNLEGWGREGGSGRRGHTYACGRFMLTYRRGCHNIVIILQLKWANIFF